LFAFEEKKNKGRRDVKSLKFFCGAEQFLQNSWSRGCEHFLNPLENVGKI
tara:strand:- start:256 stop:405 length:150 start_codon:yes stop_codon:yes gene_type:complete